jgi:hypothetical protein
MPHPGAIGRVLFNPSGTTILISGEDGTARLWDVASHKPCIPPLVHEGGYIWGLEFNPDGKTIASGGDDRAIRFWDVGTAQPIGPTLKRERQVVEVRFVADGKSLLTRDPGGFRLFPAPRLLPGDPERVAAWVAVVTGLSLERQQGLIQVLGNADWREWRERLMELGGPPETGTEQWLDPILFGPDPTARARAWLGRRCWEQVEAEFAQAIRLRPQNLRIR